MNAPTPSRVWRAAIRLRRASVRQILWMLPISLVAAATLVASLGCGSARERNEIVIFAAASLAEPLRQIQMDFEDANPDAKLLLHLAGSQQLRTQIELGADADVFISADASMVDDLRRQGLIDGATLAFARNRAAVLIAPGNPGSIRSIADLANDDVRLVIGVRAVPAGRAARELLRLLENRPDYGPEFTRRVAANVISEETNVRAVVARLALGEADAGFVYVTDASTRSASEMTALHFPPEIAVEILYGAGAVVPDRLGLAGEFVRYLSSTSARQVFADHGFMVGGP